MILAVLLFWATFLSSPASAQTPTEIRTGLFITSISELDTVQGSFRITAFLWTVDPTGTFDPVNDLQALTRSAALTEIERLILPDGSAYTALRLEATVDQVFDLDSFPFDRQTLRLIIESETRAEQSILVPDVTDSRLADFVALNGWGFTGLTLTDQIVAYDTSFGHGGSSRFSRLTFAIEIERQRSIILIENFIGFTVSLLISALIYLVPVDQIGVRVGMVTSSIFTAVGNRYSLDSILGAKVGFTLVDEVTTIVFGAVYLGIVNTIVVYRLYHLHDVPRAERVNRLTGLVVVPLSAALALWCIYRATQ